MKLADTYKAKRENTHLVEGQSNDYNFNSIMQDYKALKKDQYTSSSRANRLEVADEDKDDGDRGSKSPGRT